MNIVKVDKLNVNKLLIYWEDISKEVPYFFEVSKEDFENCLFNDKRDGEEMFNYLDTYFVEENNRVLGFIQFGQPSFHFNSLGEKYYNPNIGVIRNIYYDENKRDAGRKLIEKAESYFEKNNLDAHYAFYHALGLSCNVYHGKLHENKIYIEELLFEYRYNIEHENIYYSIDLRILKEVSIDEDFKISLSGKNEYNKEHIKFLYKDIEIGGCEVLYRENINTVYLNWIWLSDDYSNKGFGTEYMKLISKSFKDREFIRMDTDTANNNIRAQRYYEKNGYVNKGYTRSYIR